MPNIQQLMNEEIRRITRKEVKAALVPYLKAQAELRKRLADHEKRIKALEKTVAKLLPAEPLQPIATVSGKPVRVTGKRIKQLRSKLGLSQGQLAMLLGVNLHSVNHWELGKTDPQEAQKRKIAAIRDMGKRELAKLMGEKGIVVKVPKASEKQEEKVADGQEKQG